MSARFDYRRPCDREAVERRVFEVARGCVRASIPLRSLEFDAGVVIDHAARRMVMRLEAALLKGVSTESEEVAAVRHPADWWQAFKERWFPGWLLRRFPVSYKEHKIVSKKVVTHRYCPHAPAPRDARHGECLCFEFLAGKDA